MNGFEVGNQSSQRSPQFTGTTGDQDAKTTNEASTEISFPASCDLEAAQVRRPRRAARACTRLRHGPRRRWCRYRRETAYAYHSRR